MAQTSLLTLNYHAYLFDSYWGKLFFRSVRLHCSFGYSSVQENIVVIKSLLSDELSIQKEVGESIRDHPWSGGLFQKDRSSSASGSPALAALRRFKRRFEVLQCGAWPGSTALLAPMDESRPPTAPYKTNQPLGRS